MDVIIYLFLISETDGPSRPSGNRKMSEKSCSSDTSETKESPKTPVDKNSMASSSSGQATPKNDQTLASPTIRVAEHVDAVKLRQRPLSYVKQRPTSSLYDSSGSEMSRSITPQHRKLLNQMSSPSGSDRPVVSEHEGFI